MIDKDSMTTRIALFRSTKYGWNSAFEIQGDDDSYTPEQYVRLSEWETLTFRPLPPDDVVAAQVRALDNERAATVERFTEILEDIDGRKASLLAITHQEAV